MSVVPTVLSFRAARRGGRNLLVRDRLSAVAAREIALRDHYAWARHVTKEMSQCSRRLLVALLRMGYREGQNGVLEFVVEPRLASVAKHLGVSERTVLRAAKELDDGGVVLRLDIPGRRRTRARSRKRWFLCVGGVAAAVQSAIAAGFRAVVERLGLARHLEGVRPPPAPAPQRPAPKSRRPQTAPYPDKATPDNTGDALSGVFLNEKDSTRRSGDGYGGILRRLTGGFLGDGVAASGGSLIAGLLSGGAACTAV